MLTDYSFSSSVNIIRNNLKMPSNSNEYTPQYTKNLTKFSTNFIENSTQLSFDNLNKRLITEETMIEILKSNNSKQQIEIVDELSNRLQQSDGLVHFQKLDSLLNCIRSILLNSLNTELQTNCLKCILTLLKSSERLKYRKDTTNTINKLDSNLIQTLIPSVIPLCASTKIQIRQHSSDILFNYMKQTNSLDQLFMQFIRHGIENSDILISKGFIEVLSSLLTDEYKYEDYSVLVKSLATKLVDQTANKSALKALKKIENLVGDDVFGIYLQALTSNLRNFYTNMLRQENAPVSRDSSIRKSRKITSKDEDEYESSEKENFKFNLISNKILKKLFGEDEMQRMEAIEELEMNIRNLEDMSIVYPYYEDFVIFISSFLDDSNYKVRLGSLEILYSFVKKLNRMIDNCFKVICNAIRQVMSHTHQSKTMRQLTMQILLICIENLKTPNALVDYLLDKIKDRSAKAREELINVCIGSILKFGSSKLDLVTIFKKVAPLLFDIKRNVRHAALECIALVYSKLKERERNLDFLFHQCAGLDSDENSLSTIKSVIKYRVDRNVHATLNPDMTIDYAIKIPGIVSASTNGPSQSEPDINWIISATAASASASASTTINSASTLLSSRSRNFDFTDFVSDSAPLSQQQVLKRKPSANAAKRLPWEEQNTESVVPKVTRSREVAPLKAFPLFPTTDDNTEFISARLSPLKTTYQPTSSYQEKYLKRMQSTNQYSNNEKPFMTKYNTDIENSNELKQPVERVLSLDNLYVPVDDKSSKKSSVFNPFLNGQIPSKPTVARRNSGNHQLTNMDQHQQQHYSLENQVDNFEDSNRKYVTMPNIRTSAKNRKKLDKLFSVQYEESSNSQQVAQKTTRTDRTDQYSESGVFSLLSDQQQTGTQRQQRFVNDDHTSDYSSITTESPFNTKPKLLRSNSKPKLSTNSATSQQSVQGSVIRQQQQQQQQQSNEVEIVGKKLSTNSPTTPVEVTRKKAAALRNLNDSTPQSHYAPVNDEKKDDSLDIVGKGLFIEEIAHNFGNDVEDKIDEQQQQQQQHHIPEDFPLSLSFQSRLRQKTQEKIEEKQRKKVEKIKQKYKQYSIESSATSEQFHSQSENPIKISDFGLSISGYNNNNSNASSNNQNSNQNNDIQTDTSHRQNSKPSNDYFEFIMDETHQTNDVEKLPLLEQNISHRPPLNYLKSSKSSVRSKSLQRQEILNKKKEETPMNDEQGGIYGVVKEDFIRQPFKNPDAALKEAMQLMGQDEDWEKKCYAMNIIRRLVVYHEDLVVSSIHSIVIALLQEVRNLRSQVSRFALTTFGDLFTNLKRYMDIDLDIAVKAILQKNGESSDFIRTDVERCLEKAIQYVTPHKALIALINGGAAHRNPLVRKTAAQFVYKCCELMGPGKILSGIKDVTERVLMTASQFVVDGPPDIRWYGRRIFHMLMSHDEFDKLCMKHLNEATRKNIKEILDSIRVKGPGDVPSESARFSRKSVRNGFERDPISKSAGSSNNNNIHYSSNGGGSSGASRSVRYDMQTQESLKAMVQQLRNPDFRERIEAIEKFQILCETETDLAASNLVSIFDKFNQCLVDSNSKVSHKALNTMFQIIPLLGDNLGLVISNTVPMIAQNLASKNGEIQDSAADILDNLIEYIDGAFLIQPFSNLATHANVRVRPQIIAKLSDLIPRVYSRKQKQVELHVLPALWNLLNTIKGSSSSFGSGTLNQSVTRLAQSLYEQMGDYLIDRASNNSNVSSRNLDLLRDLLTRPAH